MRWRTGIVFAPPDDKGAATSSASATGSPSPSSAGQSASPATSGAGDESQIDYKAEYERLKPIEGEYGKYREALKRDDGQYLTAEQTKEIYSWSRKIAADLQAGRLTPAEAREAQRQVQQQVTQKQDDGKPDPFESWDELSAADRRKIFQEQARSEARTLIEEERGGFKKGLDDFLGNQRTQQDLLLTILERKLEHPGVDMREVLKDVIASANASPDERFKMALNAKLEPATREKAIKDAVAAALAEAKQKAENERFTAHTSKASGMLRLLPKPGGQSKLQQRAEEMKEYLGKARAAGIDV